MNRKPSPQMIEEGILLAEKIVKANESAPQNPFSERMGAIIKSPESKHFLIRMMDVAFRSENYSRISVYVMRLFSISKGYHVLFSGFENLLVSLYKGIGHNFPFISIPAMLSQIKSVTAPILFFVGDSKFRKHSKKRKDVGVTLNVNLIGEALLGEEEAEQRIKNYIDLLNKKEVDYISIKLSTIYSQISPLAHEYTIEKCVERLSLLYDEVISVFESTGNMKFVNLDMEEYRDLGITIDVFKKTLSLPKYKNIRMGIVLQAYLPDSYNALLDLIKWSQKRISSGGAPIKIRVVKGANLEMEKTEASLEDWPIAPYEEKVHSDANFKKMLLELLHEDVLKAVNVGIASHNIFDITFTLHIVQENNLHSYVDFEMLEGMANEVVDELLVEKASVLLYTPIVKEENYNSAIAYLVRRLDEGTQDGNFLKEGHGLTVNSPKWKELKKAHFDSLREIELLNTASKRTQNRKTQKVKVQGSFKNVANTDWVLPANRKWIKSVFKKWENPVDVVGDVIKVTADIKEKKRKTISQIAWSGTMAWKYEFADEKDYRDVITSDSEWYNLTNKQRANILSKAAVEMEKDRGNLISVAVCELGKTAAEVDVEVSEAIDFANYYAQSIIDITEKYQLRIEASGINLVLSPWNFPIAIPMGGVFASLAAGKRVILKPSRNAAACSFLCCQCLWKAGVPKSALSFLPTSGKMLDPFLSSGKIFDAVILTGGTDTAQFLLDRNPRLKLFAETGGKNSTIVTSLSDRDQAIKNVVQSAFGNTGQKCSATSLLVLEKEVYEDERFKKLLRDAAQSKIHGSPWNYETEIGPLAVTISDKLKESIETTRNDQWLLKPHLEGDFMLSPGIKWGVTESDFEYNNELFGPILSVMKAKDLKDAIRLVNGVPYGLTSGIESLDWDEIEYWKDNVIAGNMYANRSTTGAIVQRQPFGGMKASCFGFGMKAGGPNYVLQFSNIVQGDDVHIDVVRQDYRKAWNEHFSREIDYSKLRGQHNINRYLKPQEIFLLIDNEVETSDIEKVECAAEIIGVNLKIYTTDSINGLNKMNLRKINLWSDLENEINHNVVIRALNYERLDDDFLRMCHNKAIHVFGRRPSNSGRVEFLNYLNEQNFSFNYHRYGNLLGEQPI